MRVFRFWDLFALVIGAASILLISFPVMHKGHSVSGTAVSVQDSASTTTTKLKETINGYNPKITNKRNGDRELNLDDYRPIDPAPASKASVKPGPIEHGAPLNPYIPRPPPPPPYGHPKRNRR